MESTFEEPRASYKPPPVRERPTNLRITETWVVIDTQAMSGKRGKLSQRRGLVLDQQIRVRLRARRIKCMTNVARQPRTKEGTGDIQRWYHLLEAEDRVPTPYHKFMDMQTTERGSAV